MPQRRAYICFLSFCAIWLRSVLRVVELLSTAISHPAAFKSLCALFPGDSTGSLGKSFAITEVGIRLDARKWRAGAANNSEPEGLPQCLPHPRVQAAPRVSRPRPLGAPGSVGPRAPTAPGPLLRQEGHSARRCPADACREL